MLDKIIATFCILDDLLHILHHRNDPQAKITDSEILTIAILACQEFGGNMRKALQWVKALQFFSSRGAVPAPTQKPPRRTIFRTPSPALDSSLDWRVYTSLYDGEVPTNRCNGEAGGREGLYLALL